MGSFLFWFAVGTELATAVICNGGDKGVNTVLRNNSEQAGFVSWFKAELSYPHGSATVEWKKL